MEREVPALVLSADWSTLPPWPIAPYIRRGGRLFFPNQLVHGQKDPQPARTEARLQSEEHGSSSPSPRPRRRRGAPRGGPRALRRRPGRASPGGNRARGGVQLRGRRRERAGALGQHQGGVGQLQRGADAVPDRPLPRARLAGALPRLPHPLLPPRPGLHRQPRPRHHGEVQWRRRQPGDQRHGLLPQADALALAHRAHRRRPPVRHGAAPGAPNLGEQDGGDRHPLRDRRRGPVPAGAGAVHPPDRRQAGQGGARRRGGPPPRARQGQRLLPLHGLPHHAALHPGGHLDRRQEGSHRVQAPAGASQGSRARRHGEEREAGSGRERQGHQHLPP